MQAYRRPLMEDVDQKKHRSEANLTKQCFF